MKRLTFVLALWLGLLGPAFAVNPSTKVGNAAYSILATDVRINTTTAFTAGRTWTLPSAAATCIGQNCAPPASSLEIFDTAGAISQPFPLTIARPTGGTINGNAANLIISAAGSRVVLYPTSPTNWQATVFGDYVTSGLCPAPGAAATVTMTIAAPGVVTFTAHGITGACPIVFTTSDTLPTGITSGTTYYVSPSSITTNTFSVSSTVANALAGTLITTSGSQAGTHTGTPGVALTSTTAADVTGLSLSQGDWDCRSNVSRTLASNTSVTKLAGGISTTSATAATAGAIGSTVISIAANVMGVGGTDSKIGTNRNLLTATTNIFSVVQDTFSVSTDVGYGTLSCRRMR